MKRRDAEFAVIHIGNSLFELGWKPRHGAWRGRRADDWIKVHGRIRCNEGTWTFVDQALMLHEAVNLVQWLARAGTEGPCEIHFIEPCLAFKIDPDSANHNMIFSVTFKGEASPPWLEGDADRVWRVGYMLAGEIQRESLQTFASVLAALLDVRLNDGVSEQVG